MLNTFVIHAAVALAQLHNPPAPIVVPSRAPPYMAVAKATVNVSTPSLDHFVRADTEVLRRYLAAHPGWRVGETRRGGKHLAALRRGADGRIDLNGSHQTLNGQVQPEFTLAKDAVTPPFFRPCISTPRMDAGKVEVSLCSYSLIPGQRVSTVRLGGPGLWFDVREVSTVEAREATQRELDRLEQELAALRAAVMRDGADAWRTALPAGAIRRGQPALTIDAAEQSTVTLEAWVNPGEPGMVVLRVVASKSGEVLADPRVDEMTSERTGWSPDPEELFHANSLFWLRATSTGWKTRHDLRFELWFKPDSGEPERKLVELRAEVMGWER